MTFREPGMGKKAGKMKCGKAGEDGGYRPDFPDTPAKGVFSRKTLFSGRSRNG